MFEKGRLYLVQLVPIMVYFIYNIPKPIILHVERIRKKKEKMGESKCHTSQCTVT